MANRTRVAILGRISPPHLQSGVESGMLSSLMSMPESKEISLGSLRLGGSNPLFLIAGPCVIEGEGHARMMAERVASIAADAEMPYIFKASYDKANRTSLTGFRGPGLDEGLRILRKIKSDLHV